MHVRERQREGAQTCERGFSGLRLRTRRGVVAVGGHAGRNRSRTDAPGRAAAHAAAGSEWESSTMTVTYRSARRERDRVLHAVSAPMKEFGAVVSHIDGACVRP